MVPHCEEIQCSFEAQLPDCKVVFFSALPDEMSDEVMKDEEHEDFLFDHGR